jgi:hypothetical protein
MTADEHLKRIVGDMTGHLALQLALALEERDALKAQRDALAQAASPRMPSAPSAEGDQ